MDCSSGKNVLFQCCRAVKPPVGYSLILQAFLFVFFAIATLNASAGFSINPATIDFGEVRHNSSTSRTVNIDFNTNDGYFTLLESITISRGFSLSHNCPMNTSIDSGSCTITVTMTPNGVSPRSGILTISGSTPAVITNTAPTPTFTNDIPLSGMLAGYLHSEEIHLNFANVVLGSTRTLQAHLSNPGDTPVTISSFDTNLPEVFSPTNNCPASLASGQSCTMDVTFSAPTGQTGLMQGQLHVYIPSGILTLPLYATSVAPVFSISPSSLDLGNVNLGATSSPQQIIANNLDNVASLSLSITGPFSESNDCANAISSGSTSCTVLVSATPNSAGIQSGSIVFNVVTNDQQTLTESSTLNVTGILMAELVVSATQKNFANTLVNTNSDAQTLTLTNQGGANLSINSITLEGDFSQSNDCPAELPAGRNCDIQVVFAPQTLGSLTGSLAINTNLGITTIALSGTSRSTNISDLEISVSELSFSDTQINTSSESQTLTLTNQGEIDLTINNVNIDGDFILTDNCGTQIIAGGSCDLQIVFAPQQEGTASGSLSIDSEWGVTTVALSGSTAASNNDTPTDPVNPPVNATDLVFSVSELSFDDVEVDRTTQPQTLTLSNPGSTTVSINTLSVDGDYVLTDNCGLQIVAGASCDVQIAFSPRSTGASSGSLTIETSQGISRVTLSGSAVVPGSPIDNSEEIVELLDTFIGNDPSIASTGAALADSCPSGRISDRMQQDCNAVINAAVAGDANTGTALEEITPKSTGKANSVSRQGGETQVRNLGSRISALRAGARGLSLRGLDWKINGDNLSIALLQNAYQSSRRQGGGASADNALLDSKLGLFITGDISSGSKEETQFESGLDFDTYGFTMGLDYRISNQFILGSAFGYIDTQAELNNNSGELDTQGYSLSLYGTYYATGDYFIDFSATYGNSNFDQKRRVVYQLGGLTTVSQEFVADYDGDTASLFIGSGYDFNQAGWTFGPRLDLEYIRSSVEEFTEAPSDPEASGGGWATRVDVMDQNWLTLNLGGKVSYAHSTDWGVLIPYVRLDWLHEFQNDSQTITAYFVDDPEGQAIQITTDDPDRDYLRLRLGTSIQLQNGMTGFFDFGTLLANSQWSSNNVSLGLRMAF